MMKRYQLLYRSSNEEFLYDDYDTKEEAELMRNLFINYNEFYRKLAPHYIIEEIEYK